MQIMQDLNNHQGMYKGRGFPAFARLKEVTVKEWDSY